MIPVEYRVYVLKKAMPLMRFNTPLGKSKSEGTLGAGSSVWCDQVFTDSAVFHACFGGEHEKEYPMLVDLFVQVSASKYDTDLEETDRFVGHTDRDKEIEERFQKLNEGLNDYR